MVKVTISKHALGRILERANKWSDSALNIAWRAYTQGLSLDSMPEPLQFYVKSAKNYSSDCTYRFFEKKLYVFQKTHLITVYAPPLHKLRKSIKNKTLKEDKEINMSIKRTRKSRSERIRSGQKIYDKFFKEPEFNQNLTTEEMKDLLTYIGCKTTTATIQSWVDRNKIEFTKNHQTGEIMSFDGRTAFVLCSAYRTKTISKQLNSNVDANQSITIMLSPKVRKLFVQMAQREDITLPALLSRYLNQVGEEKLRELDRKIEVEMESLRSHYIGEVSL